MSGCWFGAALGIVLITFPFSVVLLSLTLFLVDGAFTCRMKRMNSVGMKEALRGLIRQTRSSFLDARTQRLMIAELKKRIRRDQPKLFDEVRHLISKVSDGDVYSIPTVLERYYLQGNYRDHKDVQYFLKGHLDSWPHESIRRMLNNEKNTLEQKSRHMNQLKSIKFPQRDERQIPSISSIMGISHVSRDIDILPVESTRLYTDKDQRFNHMLTKVLAIYRFLLGNTYVHSRNLQSPIARIPLKVSGEDVAQCRKVNIIRKKIRYLRHVLKSIPPLELDDHNYLTNLLDTYYLDPPKEIDRHLMKKIRREYKKFLRRTYTVDQDSTVKHNKYAFIIAKNAPDSTYFH